MMAKVLTYKDVVQMHVDTFGVEPVITGINFWESDNIIEALLDAIDSGKPYVEDEVPEGMDT